MVNRKKGCYQIMHDTNGLNILPMDSAPNKRNQIKRACIVAVGMAIAVGLTLFALIYMTYAHAIIFFLVFCAGGFYLLLYYTKHLDIKHTCVLVDNDGLHEMWVNSKHPSKKTIEWKKLKFYKLFPRIVYDQDSSYDCIVFSKKEQNEKRLVAWICKTWRDCKYDYEAKFKRNANSVFIIVRSSLGMDTYQKILDYTADH